MIEMKVYTATAFFPEAPVERTAEEGEVVGRVLQYPYHLGTEERTARDCAEGIWQWREAELGRKEFIALWFGGRIVDYYHGPEFGWVSDQEV